MPNKTVDALMEAVSQLHDHVMKLKNDVEWLKKGMIGIMSSLVALVVAVLGVFLTK